jgi:hypothetical protein
MKKTFTPRKWILYGLIVLFGIMPYNSFTQSVKRQSISSYGAANHDVNNVMVSSTAGQSYNSTGFTNQRNISSAWLPAVQYIFCRRCN